MYYYVCMLGLILKSIPMKALAETFNECVFLVNLSFTYI